LSGNGQEPTNRPQPDSTVGPRFRRHLIRIWHLICLITRPVHSGDAAVRRRQDLSFGINRQRRSNLFSSHNYANIPDQESFISLAKPSLISSGNTFSHHPRLRHYLDACTSTIPHLPVAGRRYIQDRQYLHLQSHLPPRASRRASPVSRSILRCRGLQGDHRWGINYILSGTTAQNFPGPGPETFTQPVLGPAVSDQLLRRQVRAKENNSTST